MSLRVEGCATPVRSSVGAGKQDRRLDPHRRVQIAENCALEQAGFKARCMVLPDVFVDHDTPAAMYARAGLDANGIVAKVFNVLGSGLRAARLQPVPVADLAERSQSNGKDKSHHGVGVNGVAI